MTVAIDHITYKSSEVENCSNRLGTLIEDTEMILSQFGNDSELLSSEWEGRGKAAFQERSSDFIKKVRQLHEELTVSKNKLDKSVAVVTASEEDQKAAVENSLEEDNAIF